MRSLLYVCSATDVIGNVRKMVQTIDVLVLSGNSVGDNRLVNIFLLNLICWFLADAKPT